LGQQPACSPTAAGAARDRSQRSNEPANCRNHEDLDHASASRCGRTPRSGSARPTTPTGRNWRQIGESVSGYQTTWRSWPPLVCSSLRLTDRMFMHRRSLGERPVLPRSARCSGCWDATEVFRDVLVRSFLAEDTGEHVVGAAHAVGRVFRILHCMVTGAASRPTEGPSWQARLPAADSRTPAPTRRGKLTAATRDCPQTAR
jgi:hypothetical protein